jgi:hypothetical protein
MEYESGLWLWQPDSKPPQQQPKHHRRRLAWVASAVAVACIVILGALTRAPAEAIAPAATAPLPASEAERVRLFRDFEARLRAARATY